jgi:hypothetical protein
MHRRLLFGVVVGLVALLTAAVPVLATPPTDVRGEYWLGNPMMMPTLREAGGNCFITVDLEYPFTGDLSGTALFHYRVVSHGPCAQALPFAHNENLKAWGTFYGEVSGRAGSFDFVYQGKGWPAEPGELALTARIVILSGTEGLSNLHGVLEVSYIMGQAFDSYVGQIHFDP